MKNDRLPQLFEFLKEDPEDPFLLYAIALEYQNIDLEKAREYFEFLLEKHENYVGTYYHAAQLYLTLDNPEKAEEVFKKGMQIAQNQGDHHAHRELQNAYNEFLFDEE